MSSKVCGQRDAAEGALRSPLKASFSASKEYLGGVPKRSPHWQCCCYREVIKGGSTVHTLIAQMQHNAK